MTAEKKDRRPLRIKNLADLKRHIKLGTELVATAHQYHPDIVGLTRVVTKVQTNGFYSKIKDQPDHKWSTCNHGMGFWSPFNKANAYHFTDSTVQVLNTRKNDGSVLYEMELYDGRQSMSEQNKEVPDMNEWERLHRQAQRYKEAYPPGTRIMLLGMGNDPNPVESGTRGTVRVVDDIGTLHCDFDNGRSLGVVPRRRLFPQADRRGTCRGTGRRHGRGRERPRHGNVRRLWEKDSKSKSRPSLPNRFCCMPLKRSFPWRTS